MMVMRVQFGSSFSIRNLQTTLVKVMPFSLVAWDILEADDAKSVGAFGELSSSCLSFAKSLA